jgi:hypothetical protein
MGGLHEVRDGLQCQAGVRTRPQVRDRLLGAACGEVEQPERPGGQCGGRHQVAPGGAGEGLVGELPGLGVASPQGRDRGEGAEEPGLEVGLPGLARVAAAFVGMRGGGQQPAGGHLVDDHELQHPRQRAGGAHRDRAVHGPAPQPPAASPVADAPDHPARPAQPPGVGQPLDDREVVLAEARRLPGPYPTDRAGQPQQCPLLGVVPGKVQVFHGLCHLVPGPGVRRVVTRLAGQHEQFDRGGRAGGDRLVDDGAEQAQRVGRITGTQFELGPQHGRPETGRAGLGQPRPCLRGRPALPRGRRRGRQPAGAVRAGRGQFGGLRERRRRGRRSRAALGRLFQLGRHLRIGTGRGLSPMPRPPVPLGRLQRRRQRQVRRAALRRARRVVHGGPDQRMPEVDRRAVQDERVAQLVQGRLLDPTRPAEHRAPARAVGGGEQQQVPRRVVGQPVEERVPQAVHQRQRFAGGAPRRQFPQRERVAGGRTEHQVLLGHAALGQQLHGRCAVQPGEWQLRQLGERPRSGAGRDQQRHRFGREPPPGERQRVERGPVRPVGVVHQAQQRGVTRGVGQQREHGERHEEPVGCGRAGPAEHHVQRVGLGRRELVDPVQQRQQQPVHGREAEVGLRFDAGRAQHPQAARPPGRVLEQRALADARLATQHQHPALAGPHPVEERGHRGLLLRPPVQHAARVDRRLH